MIREGLTFDDVLLIPQHSSLQSRSEVSLDVKLNGIGFCHPIIPANMKSIATPAMVRAQAMSGGLALMHRFGANPIEEYEAAIYDLPLKFRVGVSLGVHNRDRALFEGFQKRNVAVYCVDVAHGDSALCYEMVRWMRGKDPRATIIAGNVATRDGALKLWQAGASAVKVGVGPGSLCTTRIETGCGVPQLTALMDVHDARSRFMGSMSYVAYRNGGATPEPVGIIADGGIKNAGDCVKALCFADMVMCGRMFAGCEECWAPTPNNLFNYYEGSSTHKTSHVEGVVARVVRAGKYEASLKSLLEGIRSGCSYQGKALVKELQEDPELVRITSAGLAESYPHDVAVVRNGKE